MKRLIHCAIACTFILLLGRAADARPEGGPDDCWNGQSYVACSHLRKKTVHRRSRPAAQATKKRAVKAKVAAVRRAVPMPAPRVFGANLVSAAQRYHGNGPRSLGLPSRLWCGDFMAKIAREAGAPVPKHYRNAREWAKVGRRSNGQVNDIVVFTRGRRGGHVGVVSGRCERGIKVWSGNHNNRVDEACYPTSRVIAYRSIGNVQLTAN